MAAILRIDMTSQLCQGGPIWVKFVRLMQNLMPHQNGKSNYSMAPLCFRRKVVNIKFNKQNCIHFYHRIEAIAVKQQK